MSACSGADGAGSSGYGTVTEVRPEQAPPPAQTQQASATPQELLNTAGKTRLSLHGVLGSGSIRSMLAQRLPGDTVSISGAEDLGRRGNRVWSLAKLDLDLDLGFQVAA